jgi:hypothetical protein
MKLHKWLVTGVLGLCLSVTIFAQNQRFDISRFSFSLTPKVLKDGSITDFTLGYEYTENYSGELRLRFSNEAKNEQFAENVSDSLNAVDENRLEVFLMPFEYLLLKRQHIELQMGVGVYYEYEVLKEKGYFNMPELDVLGKEKVNSFSNDFSIHVLGPDIRIGFTYLGNWLNLSVHGGIVPVFYLNTHQKMEIVPLLEPNYADYDKKTWGTPYFYADAGFIFFKYLSFAFLYDISCLNYKVVDFDDNLNWYNPERMVVSQSLKLEAALLIPLQGTVYTQMFLLMPVKCQQGDMNMNLLIRRHI